MTDAVFAERFDAAKASRLDVYVFFFSFIGGLAVYVAFFYFGLPQYIITGTLMLVMASYAVVVAKVPRLRIRLDQAGDNAYYLGLLFTLSSMALALYDFDVAQTEASAMEAGARQIINNFGVALATTITGIFLRVILHQMRVDPADVENMSRIELSEAAKEVKASLGAVSYEMSGLLNQMRQRTSDHLENLVKEAALTLGDYASLVTAATKRLTDGTSEAHNEAVSKMLAVTQKLAEVAGETEAALGRLRTIEPPPQKLATRLEKVSGALEKMALNVELMDGQLAKASVSSASIVEAYAESAARLATASEAAAQLQAKSAKHIEDAALGLRGSLERVGTGLEEDRKRLSLLENQSAKTAEAAQQLEEAANQVLGRMVQMTKGLTDFISLKA